VALALFALCGPLAANHAGAKNRGRSSPGSPSAAGQQRASGATSGGGGDAQRSARARRPSRHGPVELYSINTKEVLLLRLRDDRGRPLKGVQRRFDKFLRCHHTNAQHAMSPRLVRLLYQIGRQFPGRRVEVVSGYRHPRVAKNPHSPHMKGQACDFRIAGVSNTALRDFLRRNFEKVGVGYYPNSSFVHLDVRKDRSAFWIDYSGPGERAQYSEDPVGDLKTGRADSYRPTKISPTWIYEQSGEENDVPPPSRVASEMNVSGAASVEEDGDELPAPTAPDAP
jgi:uncharacterized protein YcbK (DUF882 family)